VCVVLLCSYCSIIQQVSFANCLSQLSSVQNFVCRMLDSRSLLSAAMVSKKWLKLCQADKTLQTRIRRQIWQERKEFLEPIVFTIERTSHKNSQELATLNGCHRVTVSAVPSKFKVFVIRIIYIYIMFYVLIFNRGYK
jgi:hypothetical protein